MDSIVKPVLDFNSRCWETLNETAKKSPAKARLLAIPHAFVIMAIEAPFTSAVALIHSIHCLNKHVFKKTNAQEQNEKEKFVVETITIVAMIATSSIALFVDVILFPLGVSVQIAKALYSPTKYAETGQKQALKEAEDLLALPKTLDTALNRAQASIG